jgi:hypothetical protein
MPITLNQLSHVLLKWKNRLDCYFDEDHPRRHEAAILLDNEYHHLAQMNSLLGHDQEEMRNIFVSNASDMVMQIVKNCPAYQVVGFQPFVSPADKFTEEVEMAVMECERPAKTRRLRTIFPSPELYKASGGREGNVIEEATESIISELFHEVATDLWNNAATTVTTGGLQFTGDWTKLGSDEIEKAIGVPANFAIMGTESGGVSGFIGEKHGLRIYACAGMPGKAVVGFKGSELQCGYQIGPYIPLVPIIDTNGYIRLMTRYAKRMNVVVGRKYYSKVQVV